MHRGNRANPSSSGYDVSFRGNEHLEEQNSHREDELRGKIGALKSLTIDIGHEVKEHNRILRDVDDQFDSVGGLLRHSMNRVLGLAKSGSR